MFSFQMGQSVLKNGLKVVLEKMV